MKKADDSRDQDAAGDVMTRTNAGVLRGSLPGSCVVRSGGDECCVLALETDHGGDTLRRHLQDAFVHCNQASKQPFKLAASIGIV